MRRILMLPLLFIASALVVAFPGTRLGDAVNGFLATLAHRAA